MKGEVYITYKFYNEKGERLSIFAEDFEKYLVIKVYKCNKKDEFNKKLIKSAYRNNDKLEINKKIIEFHPEKHIVQINNNEPLNTFMRWCKKHYYKSSTTIISIDRGKIIDIKQKHKNKLSSYSEIIELKIIK